MLMVIFNLPHNQLTFYSLTLSHSNILTFGHLLYILLYSSEVTRISKMYDTINMTGVMSLAVMSA